MSSPMLEPASPRETALHILAEWFGAHPVQRAPELLAPHQQEAVQRVLHTLERRRGAILADSVGLGKTHVALGIIAHAIDQGITPHLIVPAALQAHWLQHLRMLGRAQQCRMLTHTALSRGQITDAQPALVIVDEAHQFRNPATRRYKALRKLAGNAKLLLITATPVNNSIEDLIALLCLFARDGDFRDLGVPSLESAFRSGDQRMDRVLTDVVVRRTRAAVPELKGRFPERQLCTLRYDFDDDTQRVVDGIARLDLVWSEQAAVHAADLVRLQLLKRLESSRAACYASLLRLRAIALTVQDLLRRGLKPDMQSIRAEHSGADIQLSFEELLFTNDDAHAWRRDAVDRAVSLLRELVPLSARAGDPKLACLRDYLRRLPGQRVLIFTQFKDTAEHLWLMLRHEWRTGLITGEEAWLGAQVSARSSVLRAFTNRGGGRHDIDVLIATDVLSEGLNLQAGRVIINFDLPWNPVTLMQRAGRVDRLGSLHDRIEVVSILPERGLERWLNLVRTLERKLDSIQRTVGIDANVISAALTSAKPPEFRGLDAVEQLRARFRTIGGRAAPRPRIGALSGPADATVIAVRQGRLRLLVQTGRRVAEDTIMAAEILDRALDAGPCELDSFAPGTIAKWLLSEAIMADQPSRDVEIQAAVTGWLGKQLQRREPRPELVGQVDRLTRQLCDRAPNIRPDRLLNLDWDAGVQYLKRGWSRSPKAPEEPAFQVVGVLQQRREAALTDPPEPVNFIACNNIPA